MSYGEIMIILCIAFVVLLFILKLLNPLIMRNEIFFGVRLPKKLIRHKELLKLKKLYMRNNILTCVVYMAIFVYVFLKTPDNTVLIAGIILFFILNTIIYYLTHKKVKEFKLCNESSLEKRREVILIDTSFRNNKRRKIVPSKLWFLLPAFIVVINIVLGYMNYEKLPIFIPIHWNADGKVDGSTIKSIGIIFTMPLEQIFITAYMFIIYKIIEKSKQQINSFSPNNSKEASRIFRYRWASNIIFLNVILLICNTISNLYLLEIFHVNFKFLLFMNPVIIIFILFDLLVLSLLTGQGGSRIKLTTEPSEEAVYDNFDDDRYWKFGLIYFNPKDPALFVEKRFGIAFGLNYGKKSAYVLIVALIVSFIVMNILMYLSLLMFNI